MAWDEGWDGASVKSHVKYAQDAAENACSKVQELEGDLNDLGGKFDDFVKDAKSKFDTSEQCKKTPHDADGFRKKLKELEVDLSDLDAAIGVLAIEAGGRRNTDGISKKFKELDEYYSDIAPSYYKHAEQVNRRLQRLAHRLGQIGALING